MRVILLGAGLIGRGVLQDLVETSGYSEIAVADVNLESASRLAQQFHDDRVVPMQADAADFNSLVRLFKGFNQVVNCTPGHNNVTVLKAAIAAGIDYLDIVGTLHIKERFRLHEEAVAANITAVLAIGATPGVSNLVARYALDQAEVSELHFAFASFRSLAPSPGLFDTVLREFDPGHKERCYFENGELIRVDAFCGDREVVFPDPVGKQTVYFVPHSETITLPRYFPHLAKVDVRGTWQPEAMHLLKALHAYGFLTPLTNVAYEGLKVPPREIIKAQLVAYEKEHPYAGPWAFFIQLEAIGKKQQLRYRAVYDITHPTSWGSSAQSKMTGIPTSIASQLVAKGRVSAKGVLAPEVCFNPVEFFEELKKREILVTQTVQLDGPVVA